MHTLNALNRARLRYMQDLDGTDARILLALSEDARLSGVELAQRLGLSRNTVQSRLARLESDRLLGSMDRRVQHRALGYPLTAFVPPGSTSIGCRRSRPPSPVSPKWWRCTVSPGAPTS